MIIVLDNLISNSSKHGASKVELTWTKSGNSIQLSFKDDGKGIADNILDSILILVLPLRAGVQESDFIT
jgi:signal transduction histidine kinase